MLHLHQLRHLGRRAVVALVLVVQRQLRRAFGLEPMAEVAVLRLLERRARPVRRGGVGR